MQETATDGRVEKRARRKRADWIPEVHRWRSSGQGAEEYAAAHGLHPRTLSWWARLLEKGDKTEQPKVARRERPTNFLPVKIADSRMTGVPAPAHERGEVEVVLLNGRRVRIGSEFQLDALVRLLDAVEAGGRC